MMCFKKIAFCLYKLIFVYFQARVARFFSFAMLQNSTKNFQKFSNLSLQNCLNRYFFNWVQFHCYAPFSQAPTTLGNKLNYLGTFISLLQQGEEVQWLVLASKPVLKAASSSSKSFFLLTCFFSSKLKLNVFF